VTRECFDPTLLSVDQKDFAAVQLGLVWAEELYESLSRSETWGHPTGRWPGHINQARGLARTIAEAADGDRERERLAGIVQHSAAAFWEMLCGAASAPGDRSTGGAADV
jgi:hypothetical protein